MVDDDVAAMARRVTSMRGEFVVIVVANQENAVEVAVQVGQTSTTRLWRSHQIWFVVAVVCNRAFIEIQLKS